MTFYKNLRRQVIISTLELHLFSSVPLVSVLGMEILTLLTLAESEVYFWKLLKNSWGVPFTFSHILWLLFRVLKLKKIPGLSLALCDFHTNTSVFLTLPTFCCR